MHKRTRTTVLIVAVILLLLAGAVYLRKKAPPEAARLLPESDGIVFVNLKPIRAATHFDRQQINHDADYQKFIDATGIEFERDLDEAAFALHRMTPATGPNGAVGFSTVFVGRFDGKRLSNYLAGASTSTEDYEGHTIYSIPVEDRTDRVTMLGYDVVAVSNMPTTEQIHSILDRYRSAALPFSGSSLLSEHYSEIPLLSLAWGIGKIGLPLTGGQNGAGATGSEAGMKVLGMTLPVPPSATYIASIRWAGSLHLRVEEIAPDEPTATSSADSLNALVGIFKAGQSGDGDVKSLVDSIAIQHRKDRVILTSTVPPALLQKLTQAPQSTGQTPIP